MSNKCLTSTRTRNIRSSCFLFTKLNRPSWLPLESYNPSNRPYHSSPSPKTRPLVPQDKSPSRGEASAAIHVLLECIVRPGSRRGTSIDHSDEVGDLADCITLPCIVYLYYIYFYRMINGTLPIYPVVHARATPSKRISLCHPDIPVHTLVQS